MVGYEIENCHQSSEKKHMPEIHACSRDASTCMKLECNRTIQRSISYPLGCPLKGHDSHSNYERSPSQTARTPRRPLWDESSEPIPCTPTHSAGFPKVDCLLYTPVPLEMERLELYFPYLGNTPRKRRSEALNLTQSDHVQSYCESPETRHAIVTPLQDLNFVGKVPYRGAVLSNDAADLIDLPQLRLRDTCHDNARIFESSSSTFRRTSSLCSFGVNTDDVKSIFNTKSPSVESFYDMSRSLPSIHLANPMNCDSDSSTISSMDDGCVEEDEIICLNESPMVCKEPSKFTEEMDLGIDVMKEKNCGGIIGLNSSTDLSVVPSPPLVPRRITAQVTPFFYDTCIEPNERSVTSSRAKRRRKKDEDALKWLESIALHRDDNAVVAELLDWEITSENGVNEMFTL